MKNNKTLLLDSACIDSLLDMKAAIREVEKVFGLFGQNKTQMPAKIYLDLKKYHGDFRAMPAFVEGMGAAVKWVNVHPDNKSRGLPTVMATIILSDPRSGFPLAILDGTKITNYRTGAAGGVAAKYLARPGSSVVALVGCGEQAKTQLLAVESLFKIKQVKAWGHQEQLVKEFLKNISKKRYALIAAASVKECVREADIVITTTPSRKPLVKRAWLKETAHINAIGADAHGKQELEIPILKNSKVVVDDWRQASHSGEINVAVAKGAFTRKNVYAQIADIINGTKKGRTPHDRLSVFDSTGLAIQDVALAHLIFSKAKKRNMGRFINLVAT